MRYVPFLTSVFRISVRYSCRRRLNLKRLQICDWKTYTCDLSDKRFRRCRWQQISPSCFVENGSLAAEFFLLFFLSHIVYFTTINRYIVIQIASHTGRADIISPYVTSNVREVVLECQICKISIRCDFAKKNLKGSLGLALSTLLVARVISCHPSYHFTRSVSDTPPRFHRGYANLTYTASLKD